MHRSENSSGHWSAVWANSGVAGLSGRSDGPPLPVPQALVHATVAAAERIATASARLGSTVVVDGPALLGERAALAGLSRNGDISCGGATRLLATADGWIAVSLARRADLDAVPAWLECGELPAATDDVWSCVGAAASTRRSSELVERASLLGMPCAELGERDATEPPVIARRLGSWLATQRTRDLVVVDLSSLWAGPLCANLLGLAGARVIKVESTSRPDGARLGPTAFYDLLHSGHESVAIDFGTEVGRRVLRGLVRRADIVIEASRPRALAQLGIVVGELNGPRLWVSLTGHGRNGADRERVAFGDDAAVAGGLVTRDIDGWPCFCADAVADPCTGLLAAAEVFDKLEAGGRWLIDIALSRTAASMAAGPLTTRPGEGGSDDRPAIAPPRARRHAGAAASLGEHTDSVLREFGIS